MSCIVDAGVTRCHAYGCFFRGQFCSISRLITLGALSHHTPFDLPELGHPYILPDHHGRYGNQ